MPRTVFARICRQNLRTISQVASGGARRSRTADLLNAIQALSQLSYGPNLRTRVGKRPRPENACRDPLAPRDLFRVFRVFATLLEHFQEKWNPLVDPKIPPTPASMPPA